MSQFGLQLYSVRDKTSEDFLGTIRKIGEMGYDGVQFAGFFNTPSRELKKVLDESGLVSAGSHMGLDALTGDQLHSTLEYNHEINNHLIICPSLPKEYQESAEAYKRAAEALNRIGEVCKKEGFVFGYHNHDFEFKPFADGQRGFDILFANSDPEYVKVELDCYWVTNGGLDPEAIIRKHKERCVSLHIKDMKEANGKRVSTEVGNGTLDIKNLLDIGETYGVSWFTVEQEDFEQDTLESAAINIKNLRKIKGE
ncbi:sugar phosphate isomerase/epimerase [Pullulanibacillus pueri]|uniref:Sugar phosphate isomerase n=1 Tax=Pullulanibacillus pueri TaxID=1437324 RepID=A0A8J2ZT16_9BACL|nr:sugar phosphate isomerase/epimerase [Pullulanibacillus pueri]MBM7681828.1 sugar phosphate isomerase/epimerase [Pullulanibacillus pueri]GGH76248.1 sugar phosphate isomerase [Pullulanibacillus pueri]